MNSKNIILLIAAMVFLVSCSKFSKVLKSKDYEYKLQMANSYYGKNKLRQAQMLYEELFPIFKGTPDFETLYFNYANCAYKQRDYVNAENLFKGFQEMFPNSSKSEEVQFLEAYTYFKQSPKPELEQSNTNKAIGMMQTFINTHIGSAKNKEAQDIIDKLVRKLEQKELKSAELYYNLGQYKAAAIAFTSLINNYPDSPTSDSYKLMIIKSYFNYANMSIDEKKAERFNKVINEVHDFQDRYPESKLLKEAEQFLTISLNNIKS
jgi:outer membrane protein assembly factor BamD